MNDVIVRFLYIHIKIIQIKKFFRLLQFGDMVKKIVEPSKEAQNDIGAMIFSGAHVSYS